MNVEILYIYLFGLDERTFDELLFAMDDAGMSRGKDTVVLDSSVSESER